MRRVLLLLLALSSLQAQSDWPSFGGDPGAARFSPLDQINTTNIESGASSGGHALAKKQSLFVQDKRALISSANAASIGPAAADTSRMTIASVTPIVSTGNPLDLRSDQSCARVGDEVGHGTRNRPTSPTHNPPRGVR